MNIKDHEESVVEEQRALSKQRASILIEQEIIRFDWNHLGKILTRVELSHLVVDAVAEVKDLLLSSRSSEGDVVCDSSKLKEKYTKAIVVVS